MLSDDVAVKRSFIFGGGSFKERAVPPLFTEVKAHKTVGIVDSLELHDAGGGEADVSGHPALFIQGIVADPLEVFQELVGGNGGVLCPVFENSAVSSKDQSLFDFES